MKVLSQFFRELLRSKCPQSYVSFSKENYLTTSSVQLSSLRHQRNYELTDVTDANAQWKSKQVLGSHKKEHFSNYFTILKILFWQYLH